MVSPLIRSSVQLPRPFAPHAKVIKGFRCSAVRQEAAPSSSSPGSPQITPSIGTAPRRNLLLALASSTFTLLAAPTITWAAENAAVTASLGRYVKRKKLDRIDSYVAPLVSARDQLIRIGRVMIQDPKDARSLLRSGSFSGLRASVRAVGEYTAERGAGKDASVALVSGFYKELEGLDFELLNAERSEAGTPLSDGARERLDATIGALDKLLENVPEDALAKAREVVTSLNEEEGLGGGDEVVDAKELERLGKLL